MRMDIAIIIVSWNSKEDLCYCLKSVYERMGEVSFEVTVVDNASTDGTQDMVKKEFPMVRLIANRENVGFGRACNQAARICEGKYLLFLNPDTKIIQVDFEELSNQFKAKTDIGAIVPVTYDGNGNLRYKNLRTIPRIRDVMNSCLFHNLLTFKDSIPSSLSDMQVHAYPSGSCFLMKSSVFERLGGFDENYFLFFEDADLGVRMGQIGLKIISHPEFKITHFGGSSTIKNIKLRDISGHKSALYFFKKTAGAKGYYPVKLILIAGIISETIYLTIRSILKPAAVIYKERMLNNIYIMKWHITI